MHITMNTELRQSMDKMKFALNHKWKFTLWHFAFLSGFCQFFITLLVTIINYFIIIFSNDILEIVKDFLAIKVISELDDYFFIEHKGRKEISNLLVTEEDLKGVLRIETTSSNDAKPVYESINPDQVKHN